MKTRLYSLFTRRRGTRGKWERYKIRDIEVWAFPKQTAIRVFQNYLLSFATNAETEAQLRPVKE